MEFKFSKDLFSNKNTINIGYKYGYSSILIFLLNAYDVTRDNEYQVEIFKTLEFITTKIENHQISGRIHEQFADFGLVLIEISQRFHNENFIENF